VYIIIHNRFCKFLKVKKNFFNTILIYLSLNERENLKKKKKKKIKTKKKTQKKKKIIKKKKKKKKI